LSDKISLTKTQLVFLMEMLEETNQEKAVEKFATIMIEERVDPIDISEVIDKIMAKMVKK
jgi:hypothetical protein